VIGDDVVGVEGVVGKGALRATGDTPESRLVLAGRVLLTGTGGRGLVGAMVDVDCDERGEVAGDIESLFVDSPRLEFSVLTCSVIVASYALHERINTQEAPQGSTQPFRAIKYIRKA
jgi:hypothetical protein